MRTPALLRALLVLSGAALVSQLALGVLGARALAAEILAAFAVDLLASRFGAPWYGEDLVPSSRLWRQLRSGALVATSVVASSALVALLTRAAHIAGTSLSAVSLALGAASALAGAVRREVLYRWIPVRLGRDLARPRDVAIFAVLLGAAPVAFAAPFRPAALALSLAIGTLSVTLIRSTGGLAASVATHAILLFATSTLLSSTIDLRWSSGALTPIESATGPGAWIFSAALLVAAALIARRLPGRVPRSLEP